MAAASAALELEGKRRDGSWRPCSVSLRSENEHLSLSLDFERSSENDEESLVITKEEAVNCLRSRSLPLKGSDCLQVKEGDVVLATYKDQSRNLLFDAVVEKVNRVKHSARVYCRCTFELKWLATQLEDDMATVPLKSIMKHSCCDIATHPITQEFFDSLNSSIIGSHSISTPDPLLSYPPQGIVACRESRGGIMEDVDSDVNIDGLIDKQVMEISRMADGLEGLKDNIVEVAKGHYDGSGVSWYNGARKKTRSQSKQVLSGQEQVEVSMQDSAGPILSPLAARAALASLIHGVPKGPDFSLNGNEEENSLTPMSSNLMRRHSNDALLLQKSEPDKENPICSLQSSDVMNNVLPSETIDQQTSITSEGSKRMLKPSNLKANLVEEKEHPKNKKLSGSLVLDHTANAASRRITRSAARNEVASCSAGQHQVVNTENVKGFETCAIESKCVFTNIAEDASDIDLRSDCLATKCRQSTPTIVMPSVHSTTCENHDGTDQGSALQMEPDRGSDESMNPIQAEVNIKITRKKQNVVAAGTKRTRQACKIASGESEDTVDTERKPALSKKRATSMEPAPKFSPRSSPPRTRSKVKK